jgi:hypothetical protein
MTSISYFEKGREHYLRKEYEEAVKYFMLGVPNDNPSSLGWLGHCYEFGLGVDKDLSHAKDLYNSSLDYLGISRESEEFGLWLKERLNVLKDIPSIDSESRHIPGLGNVRVKRGKYSYQQKKIRCNKDEVVVDIERRDSILSGFLYAKEQLPTMFSEWTCDGKNKFYDGYTLETDFFTLLTLKAPVSDYKCIMDDRNLTILVPEEACFEYLYVQSHILKKAKELLFKRAEIVIPKKLREVADRVGASFKKCEIVMSQKGWLAMNCYRGSKVQFCATNVQLPEKSLEALCIHELAHNYVLRHDSAFYKKMIELGGKEAYKLDQALFKEGKWPYLKF